MKKNSDKKDIMKKEKLQAIIAELSDINQRREKERAELDRIAKMLIKRDFELTEIRAKREKERAELERKTEELERFQKFAVGRELKMIELKKEIEKLKKELKKYESI